MFSLFPLIRRHSQTFLVAALIAVAACIAVTRVQAADPELVGVLALAVDEKVAAELMLDDETKAKLLAIIEKKEDEALTLAREVEELPAEEKQKRMAAFVLGAETEGMALLNEEQQKILRQKLIRQQGMVSLGNPQVAGMLKLSVKQKAAIADLLTKRASDVKKAGATREEMTKQYYERQLQKVLSPTQKVAWDLQAGIDPSKPEEPAAGGDDVAAAPGDGAPAGGEPGEGATKPPTGKAPPVDPNGKIVFNFGFTPWKDVLEWFAAQADLSMVLDAPPTGTFNYKDTREYTPGQAIDLLNSVLLTKGYTLIRRERMLMLINLEDGIPPALVEQIPEEKLDERGKFELVSVLFQLNKMTPENAQAEIEKMIGRQGAVVVLPSAKQVLVTETVGRLQTIRRMIQAVENPPAPADTGVEVVKLEHASADEVMTVARQLLSIPEGQTATPDGKLRVAVDPLGNKLYVSGEPAMVTRFKEILKYTDVAPDLADGGTVLETPQLEVHPVDNADPAAALQVMQTLLAGMPDVRLATDPKTGSLIALARPSEHKTIKATLNQMQQDQNQVEVFHLTVVDPSVAVLSIGKLFGTGEEKNSTAPRVDADITNNMLLVKGNVSQINQIRALLEKMGETPDDPTGLAETERENFRLLPVTGRAARRALEQIEFIWPTVNQGRIRVVTPSKASAVTPVQRNPEDTSGDSSEDDATQPVPPQRAPLGPSEDFQVYPPKSAPVINDARAPAKAGQPVQFSAFNQNAQEPAAATQPATAQPAAQPKAQPAPVATQPAAKQPVAAQPAATQPAATQPAASQPAAPQGGEIVVAPGPAGVAISSQNLDALDKFEELFNTLAEQATGADYTVFYLKYAQADVAAALLNSIINGDDAGGGAPGGGGGGGGGLLGGAASLLGGAGGDLLGGLLGGGAAGSVTTAGAVTITPDLRLNALVVQAQAADVDLVEELLEIIDQKSSPEDVETQGKPRLIPVIYTSAERVANVIRQVYVTSIQSGASQGRQPSPEDFIRALQSRGRGGNSRPQARSEGPKMTLSVDEQSNTLIVAAPDPLFEDVKKLVEQLDQAGASESETMRVVTLKRANPELVQRALSSIVGSQVQVSTTSGNSSSSGSRSGSSNDRPDQPSREQADQARRRAEFFNALQRAGASGSFGGRGGDSGRGGSSRGGPSRGGPPGGSGGRRGR